MRANEIIPGSKPIFNNPTGYWEHQGSYSVELVPGAAKSHLPPTARVSGNTVHVQTGRVKQSMGGIQFYSFEQPFSWGYKFIKAIKDGSGNLIWQNHDYRDK